MFGWVCPLENHKQGNTETKQFGWKDFFACCLTVVKQISWNFYLIAFTVGPLWQDPNPDFLKVIFIAQAKCKAKQICAWKCAEKAIKHRKSALKYVKSG